MKHPGPGGKILFVAAGAHAALLMTTGKGGGTRRRRMRFADAHAALTWCEANGSVMVYTPAAPMPGKN